MKVGQAFPSDWLSVDDIGQRDVTVTIEEIALKKVGRDNQYVVYFQGKRKGLVLYQKQARQIASAIGDDEMDNWTGKQITLYAAQNDSGKWYIYVREQSPVDQNRHQAAAASQQQPRPAALPTRQEPELTADDIPF